MQFIVAYDIADPRRLRRVARLLERRGVRLQKSVFMFEGDPETLDNLLNEITSLIKKKEDVVQAWQLNINQPKQKMIRGTPLNSHPSVVVFDGLRQLFGS